MQSVFEGRVFITTEGVSIFGGILKCKASAAAL